MPLTLLIGGARSGKSDLAVRIAQRHESSQATAGVTFIATARAIDDDMAQRIERHRADRPEWPTVEEPLDLDAAIAAVADDDLVVVDCLTLWVANAMLEEWSDELVDLHAHEASSRAAKRAGPTIVVTNEVGLGIHPETELGRRYRDLLGRVNRVWAEAAQQSLLIVAGRALSLHDPLELL